MHGLRKYIVRHWDPVVQMDLDGVHLSMYLSHNLPLYYAENRRYDRLLPEICSFLQKNEGKMRLIDIGANIGDTASLVDRMASGDILCVEGMSDFLPLLRANTAKLRNCHVQIAEVFCSDETGTRIEYEGQRVHGTASLVKINSNNSEMKFMTLDDIVAIYPTFKDANILKIDTDGFEVEVINGGTNFIRESRPVIYFEFLPSKVDSRQDGFIEEGIFSTLHRLGYRRAIFYDNFGKMCKVMDDISNSNQIKKIVKNIDLKSIYYYDVLAIHDLNKVHNLLFEGLLAK